MSYTPYERYREDPAFHTLVNTLYGAVIEPLGGDFTTQEFREATTVALEMYWRTHVQPNIILCKRPGEAKNP